MKFLFTLLVMAVFAAGIGIGGLIGIQLPASTAMDLETSTVSSRSLSFNEVQLNSEETAEPLKSVVQQSNLQGPIERPSPGDWIKESQIEMRPDGVFIHMSNPQWAILADTNSMDPLFDDTSHLIQMIPASQNEIQVGDIISYASPFGFTIVHRVREIGFDEDGWYALAGGDNNLDVTGAIMLDPGKIRWEMVKRVTVAIIN